MEVINKYISIAFLKYLFVGGFNFLFSTILYLFLLKVFDIEYMTAFVITWVIGIILTYIINFTWVFKPDQKLEFKKRLPKYFLVYLTSFVINITILNLLVEAYAFDPFWLQFFILPIVVFVNFFGFKYWALK